MITIGDSDFNEKPFFTKVEQPQIELKDILQIRRWKDKLVKMRDSYKGTVYYVTFDLEVKRVVEFLNNNQS